MQKTSLRVSALLAAIISLTGGALVAAPPPTPPDLTQSPTINR
ncbi:MAG: hypothetical protein NT154_39290 [Verrucomicrobia bacterium]|nr:hypothetical protein [Verrucomicrobiota bacterium]